MQNSDDVCVHHHLAFRARRDLHNHPAPSWVQQRLQKFSQLLSHQLYSTWLTLGKKSLLNHAMKDTGQWEGQVWIFSLQKLGSFMLHNHKILCLHNLYYTSDSLSHYNRSIPLEYPPLNFGNANLFTNLNQRSHLEGVCACSSMCTTRRKCYL